MMIEEIIPDFTATQLFTFVSRLFHKLSLVFGLSPAMNIKVWVATGLATHMYTCTQTIRVGLHSNSRLAVSNSNRDRVDLA